MLFLFLMGLCKTLNCPAQKAKSRGGILVVRALYRTVLTVEICSQYNQKRKKKKKRKKERKEQKNNRGQLESFANDHVLMQNNAEHPQARNGQDDAKQKMPAGTAWVD